MRKHFTLPIAAGGAEPYKQRNTAFKGKGLKMNYASTTKSINKDWCDYDKRVAQCHLLNWGIIFLDDFGCPIDNEYELEYLASKQNL